MRFHGMMLLRDEEDVIAQCLDQLLGWIDALYIYDLGSTDATWDIVQQYARRDKRVIPFIRQPTVYSDNLRNWLFHRVRDTFAPGDWCMKIDADEFYHVPPPEFVRQRLGRFDSAVHLQWYFFRLTTQEAAAYENGTVSIAQDRSRPIEERRRFYKISNYAEPRMFKYRRSMKWPQAASFPVNAGYVARERIPIRHYPHRDPEQMARRYRLRSSMARLNPQGMGGHWQLADWHQDLVDAQGRSAAQASGVGLADNSGVDSGPLLYWEPGTQLREQPLYNHVPRSAQRLAQRLVHPLLLPVLDPLRPSFDPSFQPMLIADDVNDAIGNEALQTDPGTKPDSGAGVPHS
jgi:glycosyltransferase involved in cell wall biosynthesis